MDDYVIEGDRDGPPRADTSLEEAFERWMAGASGDDTDRAVEPDPATDRSVDPRRSPAPPVPMPESFTVDRDAETLTITRRWYQAVQIFVVAFAVIWNAVVWLIAFSSAGDPFVLVFLVPFFAAGAGVGYIALAGIVNRTTVQIADGTLCVSHAPLPWPGALCIPASAVTQLYTRESSTTTRSRRGSHPSRTRTTYSYDVMVCHGTDHREQRLVAHLQHPNQALFIEYTVERYLGIIDRPIRGELRRD